MIESEGKDEILLADDMQPQQGSAFGWRTLQRAKYSRRPGAPLSTHDFSASHRFASPTSRDYVPATQDAVALNPIVSSASWESASYAHFDLLPDTKAVSTSVSELEPVTGRPAWLLPSPSPSEDDASPPHAPVPGSIPIPGTTPEEPVASRWFMLKRMFYEGDDQEEAPVARTSEVRIPCMAVFSLAGGVGKTSLVATLGRALAAHGERLLLVDTTSLGLLPFYFGAKELRSGVVQTFTASGSANTPVNMVRLDPDEAAQQEASQSEWLVDTIGCHGRGASRILIDLATASTSNTSRLLKLAPTILVPVTPDVNSVASLNAIDSFFSKQQGSAPRPIQPYYLINQFDPSLALHLDVREVMRQRLGDRLLPFALRRNPAVSEAMAQGMTVMDYSPQSPVAEDYMTLARWMRSISAPATPGPRGVRWSERLP